MLNESWIHNIRSFHRAHMFTYTYVWFAVQCRAKILADQRTAKRVASAPVSTSFSVPGTVSDDLCQEADKGSCKRGILHPYFKSMHGVRKKKFINYYRNYSDVNFYTEQLRNYYQQL